MQRRSMIRALVAALMGRLLGLYANVTSAAPTDKAASGMMGGNGMGEMMMPGNTMGPMGTGMELFTRHAKIRRRVAELPNGVHAVTESDDPQTAALIQAHVPAPRPEPRLSLPDESQRPGNLRQQHSLKQRPRALP